MERLVIKMLARLRFVLRCCTVLSFTAAVAALLPIAAFGATTSLPASPRNGKRSLETSLPPSPRNGKRSLETSLPASPRNGKRSLETSLPASP
ncbi:MAG TPA: hypothetical protein VFJ58_30055, partial [Armatimonadota bacterium]|nr:hypothetical protein [Armatimonadota bacterium]